MENILSLVNLLDFVHEFTLHVKFLLFLYHNLNVGQFFACRFCRNGVVHVCFQPGVVPQLCQCKPVTGIERHHTVEELLK